MKWESVAKGAKGSGSDSYRAYLAERGLELPPDLDDVLSRTDGAIGKGDGLYVHIWPSDELSSLNDAYAVGEFAPGLVLFGSDGGGTAFALCRDDDGRTAVATVPFVGMSLDGARMVGHSLEELLEALRG